LGLLDEVQRLLQHDVMLENFALVSSLGKALTPNPEFCSRMCPSYFLQGSSAFPQLEHGSFFFFFFFLVLGLELRTYTLSHYTSPFFMDFFLR
jgi:hypothetical protein